MNNIKGTALVYSGGLLDDLHAKTAHGLLRLSDRFEILGVIDHKHHNQMSDDIVSHCAKNVPIFKNLAQSLETMDNKPDYIVIGVAFGGGKLPHEHRGIVEDSIKNNIDVVSGLHEVLSEDAEFKALASTSETTIYDIRKPKTIDELSFWSGKILDLKTPKIAVLGTDCATGKRTVCQFLVQDLTESDIKTEIIYTGQTGFLQGFKHGFILDSTLNDFVSGELEKAILECVKESNPEIILIEGQSSLRNPSGPCGSELLLSGDVDSVILVHPFDREYFDNFEDVGCVLPSLEDEINLIKTYGKNVMGVCINSKQEIDALKLQNELKIPVVNPMKESIRALSESIKDSLL